MHEQDLPDSTLQLVIDQIEELAVTLFEEIRNRPAVAIAIAAGVVGALIGSMLAARATTSSTAPATRVVRRARGVGDAADLARLGMRLLQNPIVRGLALAAVERQLKRRLS